MPSCIMNSSFTVALAPGARSVESICAWLGQQPWTTRVGPTRVVQGCCPSQAAIDSTDLAPGASTTVKLEFMMHEGMGGPHLFEIPVYTSDPAHTEYTLQVKGNFV